MSSELQELHQNYFKLIDSIQFVEADLDYTILDKHIPYLEEMARIGNSAVSVFDLFQKKHVYASPSYKNRLGLKYDSPLTAEGFDLLMHPDDLLLSLKAGYHFLKMGMEMENSQLRDYKLINNFRIRTPADKWMRMTEQHQILEPDVHGNIWLGLSIVDVSPDQNSETPMRSRLVNQKTGELYTFPEKNEMPVISFLKLSGREEEILQLISAGYVSKQIADKLSISVHTVNTHRQNIIEKMNVANSAEAVRLAANNGILQ